MKPRICQFIISLVLFFIILANSNAQVDIVPDRADGIYKTGETVTWTLKQAGDKALDSLRFTIKPGGLNTTEEGALDLIGGQTEIEYTFDAPGSVLLVVHWGDADSRQDRAVGGAVADMDQMKLSDSRPDDFTLFWDEKLAELEAVPTNAKLEKGESEIEGVDYYKIEMDNIRGSQIQGQFARPAEGEKFPALLIVQWAGVYPLHKDWVTNRARDGWLVLNINAHDLPVMREKEFYQEKSAGELKNYPGIGNEDRETSYFLRMYLSCYRAAEYLSQRPDWNGETLVVTGASQGGLQSLMTAGFYPGITACLALVPAGFDNLGPEVGRKGGWPQWYKNTEGKDAEKVHETSRYYDVANFVPNINCPVLVGVGLLDETCPPEGILAGLNQLKGYKEVMLLPRSPHQNRNGSQIPYQDRHDKEWLPALQAGKEVPKQ